MRTFFYSWFWSFNSLEAILSEAKRDGRSKKNIGKCVSIVNAMRKNRKGWLTEVNNPMDLYS